MSLYVGGQSRAITVPNKQIIFSFKKNNDTFSPQSTPAVRKKILPVHADPGSMQSN